jgi:hypothetical protein
MPSNIYMLTLNHFMLNHNFNSIPYSMGTINYPEGGEQLWHKAITRMIVSAVIVRELVRAQKIASALAVTNSINFLKTLYA